MDQYNAVSKVGISPDLQWDAGILYHLLVWKFLHQIVEAPVGEEAERAAHEYAVDELRKVYVERDEQTIELLWNELTDYKVPLPQDVDALRALSDLLVFIPEYPFDRNDVNWTAIYGDAADNWDNYISPAALENATDFQHKPKVIAALYAYLERLQYGWYPYERLDAALEADRYPESLEHLFKNVIGEWLLNHQFVLPASTLLNVFAHPMLQHYTQYHEMMLAEQRENDDYEYEPESVHFPYSEELYKLLLDYGAHPRDAGFALHDLDFAYEQMLKASNADNEGIVLNKARALLRKCAQDVPNFTDFSGLLEYCDSLFANEKAFEVEEDTAQRNPLDERFEAVKEYAQTKARMILTGQGFHIPSNVLNATEPYKQLGIVTTAAREARFAVTAMPDAAGTIMAILYQTYVDYNLFNFAKAVAGAWASGADLLTFLKKLEGVE
jgi:hypothetical protein